MAEIVQDSASSSQEEDFQHPVKNGDTLSRRLTELSPQKRALLHKKLLEKRSAGSTQAIRPRSVTGPCPLSFAQELMWLLDQLTPGVSSYNVPRVHRLKGALNISALRQALNEIVGRHEILRTRYDTLEGQPVQIISEIGTIHLEVIDLSACDNDRREAEAQRLATEIADRGFDLKQDPPLRVALLRLAATEHILILVSHHIASDGWSKGLLFRELEALYEAFCLGKPSPLPKVALQYADFAVWQRSHLQGQVLEELLGYWKQQLAGAPSLLELPTDHPRPPVQSGHGQRLPAKFPKALAEALKEVGRAEGATLFMVGLAAFQVLLHRYTGQEDIVVGTPISGRTRTETESIVGYFSNSLALRTNLAGDPTFRELLQRVRQTTLDAYSHLDMPFEKLVVELNPERTLSHTPIYQTMFSVVTAQMEELKLPGLDVTSVLIDRGTAKFDMTLGMRETPDELATGIEFSSDLFEPATMTRLLGHWRTLLEGIVANPDRRLSQSPILTEAERHQLLVEWSGPRADYPNQVCLHQLFEAQVERTPDAVAVVFAEERLTYRVLNERANQAANLLRHIGIGKGHFVAILEERRPEFLIAMLAIFKAGAAYVPIDPNYPKDRVQYLLTKSETRTLLSRAALINEYADLLSACTDLKSVICFDSQSKAASFRENCQALTVYDCLDLDRQSRQNPDNISQPDDPLYMIFTSGSTGLPKGAIIRHNGALNHIYAQYDALGLTEEFAFLQSAPSSSDISVWQFLAPVLIGGKTVIINEADLLIPEKLFAIIKDNRVTIVEIVPVLLKVFLEYISSLTEDKRSLPDLKWLMVTGESAPVDLVNTWFQLYPSIKVVNAYGPTEASDDVAQLILDGPLPENQKTVPIGKPLANLRLYVLDDHLQLVPIGVPGEICVSGVGVGVGYWKDEEKTRASFVPNPFAGSPGEVIYRTGDLGKWLPDGNLEFLGRIDHQVKIRGFRIELGEIEAVLGQHPGVSEAVVLAREDQPGNKRLVAYLVTKTEPAVSVRELRSFLKGKLPEHMLPSAFVFLDRLPLTPNGKVDRKALPAPEGLDASPAEASVPPRDPIEETVAAAWVDVLKLKQVGVHDNFFDLGGHSLLATRMVARLRSTLGVELPLRNVFEAPTVAQLAALAGQLLAKQHGLTAIAQPKIPRRTGEAPCPLSFAQQRLWFLEQWAPSSAVYHMPFALRMRGPLDIQLLQRVLDSILQRHETLRTNFVAVEGTPVQVVRPAGAVPFHISDLRQYPEADREAELQRLFREEAYRPFNLAEALMLRAAVAQLAEQEYGVLFVMHHIASDGWSMGQFVKELVTLYDAFAAGKPSPLPPLPIQYADFALWQRQWLQGAVLEQQLAYWKRQLEGVTPLELPLDHPRPALQTYRAGRAGLELPPHLLEALKALSRDEGVTLFMTLLAAFQTLLHRYTRQDDISVGSPIAGRTHVETEPLIGFFVNTLLLRTDLSGRPSFRQLLGRVREVALGAYAHQDLPFEKLVEELRPERDTSRTPLFQVLFVLQNIPKEVLELPGLSLSPLKTGFATAKWDLQLTLGETATGLKASFVYNADLFEAATMARMLGHFQNLLHAIVANPQQSVDALPLLTAAESQQLLIDWNATHKDYGRDLGIAQLVEAQAQRTPEAIAVVSGQEELTYQELNRRANQLAHCLRAQGVGPELRVAICVERSLDMVVGMLAILKAGGAYVPLDPSFPKERLVVMLADAQPVLILTQQRLRDRLPQGTPRVLCLDTDWKQIATMPADNPVPRLTPANLAYILYTSGSTGTPKGVAMSHGALVNLLTWQLQSWAIPGAARTLQFASMCFDVSFQEILSTWSSGGTLVIVPEEVRRDPAGLAVLIGQQAVRRAYLPPVVLQHLAEAVEHAEAPALPLREIITAGEQLQITQPVASLLRGLEDCSVQNHYGPTEAHVVTACTVEGSPQGWPVLPPIGRPIFNAQIYMLDPYGRPVPQGVPGELYIGGVCLARGYFNRPELTAQKFVPNPFSTEPGGRLYRTGDLARWRPDGQLEYLGRIDHQVKVRGFRIELGEIEAVLGQHPGVRESLVLARESQPGDKRLVAYVVPQGEQTALAGELRSFLKQKLPEYMVPSAFVILERFPLTPNGKVDRRALPVADLSNAGADGFLAPRNGFEQQLAMIWEKVLGLDSVGVRTNFFEAGGHSLLAVRLFAEIEKTFGQKLPLVALFQAPTIEQLAQLLRDHTRRNHWPTIIPVQPHGTKRPLFFIANPDVNALGYAFVSRCLGPDQPVYVLVLQTENHRRYDMDYVGRWKGPNTPREHEILAATYLKEMRTIQARGPYLLGGMCEGAHIAFAMARLLQERGEKVALLGMIDAPARDNLNRLWYVRRFVNRLRYYRRRLGALMRLKPGEQWRWLRAKFSPPRQAKPSSCAYVSKLPFYEGDITLFRVDKQSYWFRRDPELGWGRHTRGRVEICRVPGDHKLVLREPAVQVFAEQLKACLGRIENQENGSANGA